MMRRGRGGWRVSVRRCGGVERAAWAGELVARLNREAI
jgi:hypothetical protein